MNKHDINNLKLLCESLTNVPGIIRRVRLFGFEDFEKKKPAFFLLSFLFISLFFMISLFWESKSSVGQNARPGN